MGDAAHKERRRAGRAFAEPNTMAQLALNGEARGFSPNYTCLVRDKSQHGVCLILISLKPIPVGKKVKIVLGQGSPLMAEIRWVKQLDAGVLGLGLQFF